MKLWMIIAAGGLAFGVGLFVLIFTVVPKYISSRTAGPLNARIAEHYQPEDILMKEMLANNFGLESLGLKQVRGGGALVLTREGLHFFMIMPKKEVRIPLAAMTEISIAGSHLGKTVARDLLKISFTVDGKADSIAWLVPDPQAWKARLEELKRGG